MKNDIILAGVPRSGTTLTCALLNKVPDTIALHEPMVPKTLAGLERRRELPRHIQAFSHAQRASILAQGKAVSKSSDGKVPDNPFGERSAANGRREKRIDGTEISVDPNRLSLDFSLVLKHPNCFAATLDVLVKHFPCYAVVRNPLSVLLSWQSLDLPVSRGHAPNAEAFDEKLAAALAGEPDLLARQIILLDWHFEQYTKYLPRAHVIRYEEIVASGGRALAVIVPRAGELDEPLRSKNLSRAYELEQIGPLAERLLASRGAYWNYYDRGEIEELLSASVQT